jgi:hypothetical protein
MKKNSIKDAFDTECWCHRIIADPYQVFAETFFHSEMCHFRSVIKKIFHYAEADEIYKDKSPCDVLLYMKIIRSVIKAAHSLKEKKKGPIDVSELNVFNKNYYCSHLKTSTEWEDFPRFLSMKAFCNPYPVFKKFFKYQTLEKWLRDWEEAVDCALSECSGGMEIDMIGTYTHLAKLVEAAHLINVREVNHIGGTPKNRFY